MASKIYGVNVDEPVTPIMVRDAITECFRQAHCLDTGVDFNNDEANLTYCRSIVQKAFADAGGDFNNPTKDSIVGCLGNLVQFSKNFRDTSIVEKHFEEIMKLVNRIE